MTNTTGKPSEPKDGFDLIEYPCDYSFKAMCRAAAEIDSSETISAIIRDLVSQERIVAVRSNQSRTGKFESVTATVRLDSREQLERIYNAISACPSVVMTL